MGFCPAKSIRYEFCLWNRLSIYSEVIGYSRDIPAIVVPVSMSYRAGDGCSSQESQLGKTVGYFAPLLALIEPSSTTRAR